MVPNGSGFQKIMLLPPPQHILKDVPISGHSLILLLSASKSQLLLSHETWTYVHPHLQRSLGNVRLLEQVLQKAEPATKINMLTFHLRGTNLGVRVRKKWGQRRCLVHFCVCSCFARVSIGMLFSRETKKRN